MISKTIIHNDTGHASPNINASSSEFTYMNKIPVRIDIIKYPITQQIIIHHIILNLYLILDKLVYLTSVQSFHDLQIHPQDQNMYQNPMHKYTW